MAKKKTMTGKEKAKLFTKLVNEHKPRWIIDPMYGTEEEPNYICSACEEMSYPYDETEDGKPIFTPYCPWCGAEMEDMELGEGRPTIFEALDKMIMMGCE